MNRIVVILALSASLTLVGFIAAVPKRERVRDHRPGEVVEVEIANGVKMSFCWIPAGKVTLGSPAGEDGHDDDEAEHEFATKGFWLGKYPVTQEQWEAVMGDNPSDFSITGDKKAKVVGMNTSRFPVEMVSWYDCQFFLETLNGSVTLPGAMGKGKMTLPHEDEWEYACRGGNRQPFYFGDELNGTQANCNGSKAPYGKIANGPFLGRTTEVGSYETASPHPWGLCDMSGNVWNWCSNRHSDDRVLRGGSWDEAPSKCRSAARTHDSPRDHDRDAGFRVAVVPE
jgi:formylglycine-generating enzyme required for sulfatase activity